MKNNDSTRYKLFKAKDARFDGRFFVGVASTGIYCRPICPARLPKPENCTFYDTAAAAERAGFRPCMLCRPELAPGAAPVDAARSLALRAARMLEENSNKNLTLEQIAERLGCSTRHLRRVFAAEYAVTPVQYLQTCRLLLAKNLLTSTELAVIEVATAAGFGSLRRFNDLFKERYRLTPTELRRGSGKNSGGGSGITLGLGYRQPYRWEPLLEFLAARTIPGVEMVKDGEYYRTARFTASGNRRLCGWIKVANRPEKSMLEATVDPTLLPVLPQVMAKLRQQFDLYCQPDAVYETLASMNAIRPNMCVPGVRLPGSFDAFEMAVRAVLGQQITVKAARTLVTRLVEAYGVPLQTDIEGLSHTFPAPEEIAAWGADIGNKLGTLGITGARSRTIGALAEALARKTITLDFAAEPEEEMQKLLTIPGIGAWTANYIAMRAMSWPDAFPHTDYGVKKALAPRTEKEIFALAEAWRPWRAYATINLWNSL